VLANGRARLYVDGFEEASSSVGTPCTGTDALSIAVRNDGANPFTGEIDEVAVYAGGLAASRIAAHYGAGTNSVLGAGTRRYYLGNNSTQSVPAAPQGGWNDISQRTTAWLGSFRVFGSQAFIAPAESVTSADWNVLGGVFETQALPAQTVGGTLNWALAVKESAAAAHFNWHVHAWVAAGDSSTVRGVLLNDYTEPAGTNEWPTVQQGWGPSGGPVGLNPVTIVDGDHIVVEIGYVARNTDATSYAGTVPYHSGQGTQDAVVGDTDTTHKSWVEFSGLAVFSAPPPTPTATPTP
jgi:Concanavalin A-like lectin/glucanases superfamily